MEPELIGFCALFLVASAAVAVPLVIALRRRCPRCGAALLLLSDFMPVPRTGPSAPIFSEPEGPEMSDGWCRYRCTGCKAEFWRYMESLGVGRELISAESFDPSLRGLAKPGR